TRRCRSSGAAPAAGSCSTSRRSGACRSSDGGPRRRSPRLARREGGGGSMRVHFPTRVTGQRGTLAVLEIEFTSKARRVVVRGYDGLEPLDLKGEKPGGTYDVPDTLPRLHVPVRVSRDGPGRAR